MPQSIIVSLLYNLKGSFLTLLSGNPYWKGRLSTVDLLVLISLDMLLLLLQKLFTILQNKLTYGGGQLFLTIPFS
jgi:hypothetical protein